MPLFRHHRRRSGPVPSSGREVVRLRGDLDARTVGRTGRHLLRMIEKGPDVLEVDLTELRHLSPVGCAAFFTAVRAARVRGTRLIITHPSDQARTAMRQIGLTYALTRWETGTR
ncbi:STAS domain-containing protein [Streptomyces caniscabiei]|uniref:STAS domain-containing protein n=1 Tax=Streptomyces caniscabiei TaxID=2746961 RepID=A0A927L6J7_9ACTN|nr:STAS domain-containing protein [Streptomyces caniscabiei]MBD9701145.1 STAS domain-containing protein [Streptomyces caniscabiei]MBD9725988.1 STAS domain-containing protein [Streptomyces caniscabiei]MDX3507711.1 STAS domain-containing protein [Streptomyces caniscabiei]MDX3717673.1 STAS domain-containing protein [Streptomyces caniscabiei]MDX3726678.1 STAS domain-containing protein [Streptomyces caniscabiei]